MAKPKATVNKDRCLGCAGCVAICPVDAITFSDCAEIIEEKCISCYLCVNYCPIGAIYGGDKDGEI